MPVRAVIFDLDGTITQPSLDFDAIRSELGIAPGTPVLEAMAVMDPARRAEAARVLDRHESAAAASSTLHEGAQEVLAGLRHRGIRIGLLTRNSRQSVDTVLRRHGLRFDFVRTREDGAVKPSPEPVLAVCRALGVEPGETLTVGDYLFDIQSGAAAGTRTALMVGRQTPPAFARQADYVIRRLDQILEIVDGRPPQEAS